MCLELYDRYLKNSEMHFGIYAVAYFTCEAWDWANDSRKTGGESRTAMDELKTSLTTKAELLSNSQKSIEAFIIDARINQ
jgi:hypothetical protein